MSERQKTTVYLDAASYRELKRLARARGCAPAMLVREAVVEYAASRTAARKPRTVGGFGSGQRNLSERAEDLLDGIGRTR